MQLSALKHFTPMIVLPLDKRPVKGFLVGVHFHDAHHEAASRLADKLSNVSAVTGHRDLRMLKRYYHLRTEDLAKKLG